MAALEIARVAGLATIQDAGRPGRMHEGVPPGGALVPELLARANEAAGNAPGAAAIELFGAMTLVASAEVVLATDEGAPRALAAGESIEIRTDRYRARYISV